MTTEKMTPEIADMLRAREQLMEDIDSIIESNFGLVEYKDEVIKQLCDAVCKNFPLLMEPK
jgi:endonuclease III